MGENGVVEPLEYRYVFAFDNGETKEFRVVLDGNTMAYREPAAVDPPAWTRLEWVGFVSNADAKTVFYIDNLKIGNR